MLFGDYKISFFIFCGSQISIYMKKKNTPIHTYPFAKKKSLQTAILCLVQLCSHFSPNYHYTAKPQKTVVRKVMVLYWSLWFSVKGSHSQGETITVLPLLCDSLGQKNKNLLCSWSSMNRNRRRWDLSGTSVPGLYSYTKTCGILSEKCTLIMTSVFWVIGELAPATAQWLVHHCVTLV